MAALARARRLYPDAFCQAIRPFSAISSRWRSRCVGAISAVSLGTAVDGGRARGHDDGRRGMALGDAGVDAFLVVRPVAGERGDLAVHLVEQGTALGGVVHVAVGQRGRHDPAGIGVHAEVEMLWGRRRGDGTIVAGSVMEPLHAQTS